MRARTYEAYTNRRLEAGLRISQKSSKEITSTLLQSIRKRLITQDRKTKELRKANESNSNTTSAN